METVNDTRVATVEVNLEDTGVGSRDLGTISIRSARDLARHLHELCNYADADLVNPEDFGTLTFGELAFVDLGPWNRADLNPVLGWILDDLLELIWNDRWDAESTLTLTLTVH